MEGRCLYIALFALFFTLVDEVFLPPRATKGGFSREAPRLNGSVESFMARSCLYVDSAVV